MWMKSMSAVGDFIKRVMEITSKHYPDRARFIYILNVGWTFNAMWAMVSKVIDPVTRLATAYLLPDDYG